MLGEFNDWQEFLEPAVGDLGRYSRHEIRAAEANTRRFLSKEIKKFCSENFFDMTEQKLSDLYEEIKALRGLEMPLAEFQSKYSRIRPEALQGQPLHSTLSISLWGLKFEFPEMHLTKDIVEGLKTAKVAHEELKQYENKFHAQVVIFQSEIQGLVRRRLYGSRTSLLCCFNLLEAYFNGIAWEFSQRPERILSLSERKKKMIKDLTGTSLIDKMIKYPEIILGHSIFGRNKEPLASFISTIKPFRDSLVHPSPFSAPEKFGGYDKLRNLYSIDLDAATGAARTTCTLISDVHKELTKGREESPPWLAELLEELHPDGNTSSDQL